MAILGSISGSTTIRDPETGNKVNVVFREGAYRLAVDAITRIEQLFGRDNIADDWFWVDTVATGGTLTMYIASGPSGGSYTKTFTVLAGETIYSFASRIVVELNNDATFRLAWKATIVKDNAVVHISSNYFGEFGERPNDNDWLVTSTGGVTTRQNLLKITRQGKSTSLTRDPRDPRVGILGISGVVTTIPGEVGDLYIENATNNGSPDMQVNGSLANPVIFRIPVSTLKDTFIKELRFYGGGNGIKFGQFLSKSGGGLTNGILVRIKSDDQMLTMPVIYRTEDFKNKWALGSAANFTIDIQAGLDQFLATFVLDTPFPLRKQGTFTTNDYVEILIRDNLNSGLTSLQFLAVGFEREA